MLSLQIILTPTLLCVFYISLPYVSFSHSFHSIDRFTLSFSMFWFNRPSISLSWNLLIWKHLSYYIMRYIMLFLFFSCFALAKNCITRDIVKNASHQWLQYLMKKHNLNCYTMFGSLCLRLAHKPKHSYFWQESANGYRVRVCSECQLLLFCILYSMSNGLSVCNLVDIYFFDVIVRQNASSKYSLQLIWLLYELIV